MPTTTRPTGSTTPPRQRAPRLRVDTRKRFGLEIPDELQAVLDAYTDGMATAGQFTSKNALYLDLLRDGLAARGQRAGREVTPEMLERMLIDQAAELATIRGAVKGVGSGVMLLIAALVDADVRLSPDQLAYARSKVAGPAGSGAVAPARIDRGPLGDIDDDVEGV